MCFVHGTFGLVDGCPVFWRKKIRANKPHKSAGATPTDGELVEIEQSGKRASAVGLHRLPTLLALASAQKWGPNLGPAAIRGKILVPVRKPSMVVAFTGVVSGRRRPPAARV
jgi:hypothetical protein